MQIYIEYGTGTKIKNLSTTKTEQCYAPVFFDGPVDLEKLAGYLTYIGPDGAVHASFDPQAWEDYQAEQRELEAREQAQKMLDDLSYKTVLDTATDEQALVMRPLYPVWQVDQVYKKGAYLQYGGELYRVLQDHTSQADWTPDKAVSLYVNVADPANPYPPFKKPTGAHDAYNKGDGITFEEKHYRSKIDGNVYSPVESPDSWELVE
ncbi:carbohydrate-binding protein [uncultured Dubosiella sp.]|uniref:carbohydrate-binding protein n=1 Tax=uncultured Dubosiella sp. TaxID=1937011 RepID=UPI002730CB3D|nr:carbohydrate-binding protein [uncultured Dubosiella sp.]